MDKAKRHYSFILPQAFMVIHRYENEEIFGDTWSPEGIWHFKNTHFGR